MVSSSKIESLAQRFAPYIDELQEFFSSRKVSFGTFADLQAFPGRLREPAFHEEMVSMVRSILYRESEGMPRTELMDVIAVAVAGPQIEEGAAELHEPLRQILLFVTEVVRSQRITLPPEMAMEEDAGMAPGADATDRQVPLALAIPDAAVPYPEPEWRTQSVSQQATPASAPTSATPINDRLSRALFDSGSNASGKPASEPAPVVPTAERQVPIAERPVFSPERAALSADPRRSSRSVASFLRHAYWIPGVCALVLVVAVALYLNSRTRPLGAELPAQTPATAKSEEASSSATGSALATASRRAQRHVPQEESSPTDRAADAASSESAGRPGNDSRSATRTIASGPAGSSPRRNDLHPSISAASIKPRMLGGREGVFLASSGMMAAHLLTAPAPHYPKLASLTHVEGEVIVQVVVARDGSVEATRVLEGPRLLRGAAEHAIRHWRYRPYLVDSKPTDVATIVTVNFRLSR